MSTFGIVLSLLIVGAFADTFKEVHPGTAECTKKCYAEYMGEDLESKTKCEACCSGCQFLSDIGLTEVNNEVKKDTAQTGCYSTCDSENKVKDCCHAGCDIELEVAEIELKNMDLGFGDFGQPMGSISDLLNSFFKGFGLPTLISVEPVPEEKGQVEWVPIGEGKPVVEFGHSDREKDLKSKEDDDEKVKKEKDEVVEDSGDMDLFSILKDMGIIEDDSSDDSYQSHKQALYPELSVDSNHHKSGALRDREEGGSDGTQMAYLRGMWQDRNTMQILLIASITACLFAILWMLCNSSNDPVVRRVNNNLHDNEKPPSYSVIYGQDEKKFPILVVAGIEEEADELPKKVPLGVSTQI